MWKFIEKLRTLPENQRKATALFSSAGITGVILLSWLVFPVPHFGSLSNADKERKNAEQLTAPFSVIGEQFHEAAESVKNEWSALGGSAGLLSAVSTLKENIAAENATSSATTAEIKTETVTTTE
jgi:hypothetical protein